eukprot:8617526-Lingulodinium_polyedra.AAC.1
MAKLRRHRERSTRRGLDEATAAPVPGLCSPTQRCTQECTQASTIPAEGATAEARGATPGPSGPTWG